MLAMETTRPLDLDSMRTSRLTRHVSEIYLYKTPDVPNLCHIIRQSKSLQKVSLNYNSISTVDASAITEAIQQGQSLAKVDLSFGSGGAVVIYFVAKAVAHIKSLAKVDVCCNSITRAILQSTLSLIGNAVGALGLSALGLSALAEIIQRDTWFVTTSDYRIIGDADTFYIAEAIKQSTSLTSVNLSWNRFIAGHASTIAEGIKQSQSLKAVDLSWNRIGSVGASAISEAIKQSTSLTAVNLSANTIDATGAAAIAEAIKQSQSLATLDVSWNLLGAEGASTLAGAIAQSRSLTAVMLTGNSIGDVGAAAIAEAIKRSKSLERVDLSCNAIGDVGAAAIAEAIKQSKSLKKVDLSGNKIGLVGTLAIKQKKSSMMVDLAWNPNKTMWDVVRDFFSFMIGPFQQTMQPTICWHVVWMIGLSAVVWLGGRCAVADVDTWRTWHDQLSAYDFLTSPRASSYDSRWTASFMYALAWWFPRTMCIVHAYWRGMWQVGALTALVEPFSMVGAHYVIAWCFHLWTSSASELLLDTRAIYRCILLFTKARAWLRRAPSLSSSSFSWQQRKESFLFWRWDWQKLVRETYIIFILHLVFGQALTWWHLSNTLFF